MTPTPKSCGAPPRGLHEARGKDLRPCSPHTHRSASWNQHRCPWHGRWTHGPQLMKRAGGGQDLQFPFQHRVSTGETHHGLLEHPQVDVLGKLTKAVDAEPPSPTLCICPLSLWHSSQAPLEGPPSQLHAPPPWGACPFTSHCVWKLAPESPTTLGSAEAAL